MTDARGETQQAVFYIRVAFRQDLWEGTFSLHSSGLKSHRKVIPSDIIQTHLVVSEKSSSDVTRRHVFRAGFQKCDGFLWIHMHGLFYLIRVS